MVAQQIPNLAWTRKHDNPRHPLIAHAPNTAFVSTLQDIVDLCRDRDPDQRLRAAGSHWGLSRAAISDYTFVETHDPRNHMPAMDRTLHDLIPARLNPAYLQYMRDVASDEKYMIVHVEAGKRIYQLYAELDQKDDLTSLATLGGYIAQKLHDPRFTGPWGFATLGGAGGQTVVGALNTGTHGGDFDRPPVADSVLALHLVSDGGRQFWIEPESQPGGPLFDDDQLREVYETDRLGELNIVHSDDVFDAALVSVGRFGVIYSVVLKALSQYALHEKRRLHIWQDIKDQITDLHSPLYRDSRPPGVTNDQRFLQIAVSLTTHAAFTRNLVGVTKRWTAPDTFLDAGRAERVGDLVTGSDPDRPMFTKAGNSHAYDPDPNKPGHAADPGMLEKACANSSFIRGVIGDVKQQLQKLIDSDGAEVAPALAAVAAIGGGGLLALLGVFAAIIALLDAVLDATDDDTRFGEVLNVVKDKLLDPSLPPDQQLAGLFAWQLLYYISFSSEQDDRDYEAISYAVMDQHDYFNVSCEVNVDSVEVFFDAVDDRLVAFVDALIAFETAQEYQGKAAVGYASLRFTRPTRALIGMQQWPVSCAIEIACLKDVTGGAEMVKYAADYATNPNIGGVLHWGQHNESSAKEIALRFGAQGTVAPGHLRRWRDALTLVTGGGDAFSSKFTRRTGLEP